VEVKRAIDSRTIEEFKKLTFPPSQRLKLPAFPQESNLFCEIMPARYRHRKSEIFTLRDDKVTQRDIPVLRNPKEWNAQFVLWNQLPQRFSRLKQVLAESTVKVLKGGPNLGVFTEAAYDQVDAEKVILAKTSLLNLFTKLTEIKEPVGGKKPWFSFIRRIHAIGRERLYAEVEPEMADLVKKIRDDIGNFEFYERAVASNHHEALQKHFSNFEVFKGKMFSIKTDEAKSNLQIIIAPSRNGEGEDVVLLDTDIDENGELLAHMFDAFVKHKFTGGTHPFDIHEYLSLTYPEAPLGYSLV
jgi:hypothetical protein